MVIRGASLINRMFGITVPIILLALYQFRVSDIDAIIALIIAYVIVLIPISLTVIKNIEINETSITINRLFSRSKTIEITDIHQINIKRSGVQIYTKNSGMPYGFNYTVINSNDIPKLKEYLEDIRKKIE